MYLLAQNRNLTLVHRLLPDAFLKKIAIFISRLYYRSGFLITLTQNSIRFHYFNYLILIVQMDRFTSYETLFQAKTHACCSRLDHLWF